MKLFYEYTVIFFNLSPTSNHRHPLQVENCDSNSRLVVDEDDNGKSRLQRVKYCGDVQKQKAVTSFCKLTVRLIFGSFQNFWYVA